MFPIFIINFIIATFEMAASNITLEVFSPHSTLLCVCIRTLTSRISLVISGYTVVSLQSTFTFVVAINRVTMSTPFLCSFRRKRWKSNLIKGAKCFYYCRKGSMKFYKLLKKQTIAYAQKLKRI